MKKIKVILSLFIVFLVGIFAFIILHEPLLVREYERIIGNNPKTYSELINMVQSHMFFPSKSRLVAYSRGEATFDHLVESKVSKIKFQTNQSINDVITIVVIRVDNNPMDYWLNNGGWKPGESRYVLIDNQSKVIGWSQPYDQLPAVD